MKDTRAKWLERVKAEEQKPHNHQWEIYSGTTDGYLKVYCWCGAWASQSFSGKVSSVVDPLPETRTRQFEKRLWTEQHST